LHVPDGWSLESLWQGALGKFVATVLLLVFILVLLERCSTNAPIGWFLPVALGIGAMLHVTWGRASSCS
jgi:di/tricarboxylate transporter